MKRLILSLLLSAHVLPALAETPDSIDLSDCRVLAGMRYPKAYKDVMERLRRDAQAGDLEARRSLAGVANNRFFCQLEKYSDNAGWAIIEESGKDGVVSAKTNTVAVSAFRNDAATMKALKEAYRTAHDLGDIDVARRNLAAGFVADYKEAFKDEYPDAYRNAVGAREVACRRPEAIGGKTDTRALCTMARASAATLYPLIAKDRRAALEQEAAAWAESYVAKRGK